jgi:hypothetical protein
VIGVIALRKRPHFALVGGLLVFLSCAPRYLNVNRRWQAEIEHRRHYVESDKSDNPHPLGHISSDYLSGIVLRRLHSEQGELD